MKKLADSFKYALHGIAELVRTQRNARVHLALTFVVLGAALMLKVTHYELAILFLAMGLVWSAEAMNTAMELLADTLHPRRNAKVGRAKDLAAASVLLSAIAATCVAASIFYRFL